MMLRVFIAFLFLLAVAMKRGRTLQIRLCPTDYIPPPIEPLALGRDRCAGGYEGRRSQAQTHRDNSGSKRPYVNSHDSSNSTLWTPGESRMEQLIRLGGEPGTSVFHEVVGNHVANDEVGVFDSSHVLHRHLDIQLGQASQFPAVAARQGNGLAAGAIGK